MTETPQTIPDLLQWLSAKFQTVEDAPPIHICPTGEPFVLFRFEYVPNPEKLLAARIFDYASGRAGKLYWRTRPEATATEAYARLIISEAEPLQIAPYESEEAYCRRIGEMSSRQFDAA